MTNQVKVKATPAERWTIAGITLLTAVSFFLPWVGDFFFESIDGLLAYLAMDFSQYANAADVHHIDEFQAGTVVISGILIFPLILLTVIAACIPGARMLLRISALSVGICACLITLCMFLMAFSSPHVDFFEEVGIFDGFYLTLLCGVALVAFSVWKLFATGDQGRRNAATFTEKRISVTGDQGRKIAAFFTGKRIAAVGGAVVAIIAVCLAVANMGSLQPEEMNDRKARILAGPVKSVSYPNGGFYTRFALDGSLTEELLNEANGGLETRSYESPNVYRDRYGNTYRIEYGRKTRTDTRISEGGESHSVTYGFDRHGRIRTKVTRTGGGAEESVQSFYAGGSDSLPFKTTVTRSDGKDSEPYNYTETLRYDEIDEHGNWTKSTIDVEQTFGGETQSQQIQITRRITYYE